MDELRIEVYHHPNPEIKSFLTGQAIVPPRLEIFQNPLDADAAASLKRLGTIGSQAVRAIMAIPGVREVLIKPKDIRVKKEKDASWDRIQKEVMHIMEGSLRKTRIKIIKPLPPKPPPDP